MRKGIPPFDTGSSKEPGLPKPTWSPKAAAGRALLADSGALQNIPATAPAAASGLPQPVSISSWL